MKKTALKLLSIVLCLALLGTVAGPLSVLTSASYEGTVPVIYITGQGTPLSMKQEDGTFESFFFEFDKDDVIDVVKDNADVLIKAFLTQNWKEFDKLLIDTMTDLFSDFVLDDTGSAPVETVSEQDQSYEKIKYRYDMGFYYGMRAFAFNYDWRVDPLENMEVLSEFIDKALRITGKTRFAFCGRCEGACLILQYIEWYKQNHDGQFDPRISDIVFCASAANGASPLGEAFSGQLCLDADSAERFIYDTDLGLDIEVTDSFTVTDSVLREIITVLSNMYGLDLACWAVNNVYEQIYLDVVPQVLRNSFATFPGFWAMVSDEYYEDAKKVCFGGQEERYAKLIEKIDRYHYDIMNRNEEIIAEAIGNGVEVSDVVKYGKQHVPCTDEPDVLSDEICKVSDASWGATTMPFGQSFSDEYMAKARENGTDKYISPDGSIDASTGLLADTTWYVKGLAHMEFPDCLDKLLFKLVNGHDFTVFSDENYPQYWIYDKDTDDIYPDNGDYRTPMDAYFAEVPGTFFRRIKPLFRWIFRIQVFILKILTPRART